MARAFLNDADTRILDATIKVAGNSRAGHFSTEEIAKVAHLSEFTVYNRFKNKKELIIKANDYSLHLFLSLYEKMAKRSKTSGEFFDRFLTELLAHPYLVYFGMNYSLVFPRLQQAGEYQVFQDELHDFLTKHRDLFRPDINDEQWFRLFSYGVRSLLGSALVILDQAIEDNPETRKMMYLLTYKGIVGLPRKKSAPELHQLIG
jgi:AcrR family transcriptional regulator